MTPDLTDEPHDDFGGLQRDLPVLLGRRDALRWLGGASLAGLLAACGINSSRPSTAPPTTGTSPTTAAGVSGPTGATAALTTPTTAAPDPSVAGPGDEIPNETPGPFPADGSNGPNVFVEEGVARVDLTSSFGPLSGVAEGIPTNLRLTVVEAETGAPIRGAIVYLWHCTADGRYSIYEIADQNYLRGVQASDDAGRVTFATIFPGCYPGRWPHCHFEVYPSMAGASAGSTPLKTSQLALPQADCEAVFADPRYGDSAANLARLSLAGDIVFRDGWADQLATVSGSPSDGYTASLLARV